MEKRMKILIVDDVAFLREELREALERISPGNEYTEADNYISATELIAGNHFDIAFLDIQIPGQSGLKIAEDLKKKSPDTNVVIVTAYSEYALDAFKLFVSGYLLKPISDDDLREVLDNLRKPVHHTAEKHIEVRCFGNFEVFANNSPMQFKRSKEKELLAYLICLKGASATRNEICANIFEENISREKAVLSFKTAVSSLRKDLLREGVGNILIHVNNSYAVDTSMIDCDYYDYITGKGGNYRGEFMNQYDWAEQYIYGLENY